MRLNIKVKLNSKIEGVAEIGNNCFEIRVSVPPIDGKANQRVIEILAEYFNVPKSRVSITKGLRGKNKVVVIDEN